MKNPKLAEAAGLVIELTKLWPHLTQVERGRIIDGITGLNVNPRNSRDVIGAMEAIMVENTTKTAPLTRTEEEAAV